MKDMKDIHTISISYCIVSASGWEDNPRALASRLSPIEAKNIQ